MSETIDLCMTWDKFSALKLSDKAVVYDAHKRHLGKTFEEILEDKTWVIYFGQELLPRLEGNNSPAPSGQEIEKIACALNKPPFVYRRDVTVT